MASSPASSRRRTLALACLLVAPLAELPSRAAVDTPNVTGPIPATAAPGDPSRNYPFLSMRAEVTAQDYREDEFFVEGRAYAYSVAGPALETAKPDPGGPYAYKTRVIVRRPVSPARFNGTVILEWINIAAGHDQENEWWWSHEHMMRAGYAYVGASAQARGLEPPLGLKAWNPTRYGSLDVNNGGTFMFQLSYDIYSQVAQALKHPDGRKLLGDLAVRNVIATGHSASAARLRIYYNAVHPTAGLIDGFVFHGIGNMPVRTDLRTPAWKLLAEGDVNAPGYQRQPDTESLRTWEIAGAAHAGWDLVHVLDPLVTRDLPQAVVNSACDKPPLSRVPSNLVQDAVYDRMKSWIEMGTSPPHAPPIARTAADAPEGGTASVVARDEHGNARGGIQLAAVAVPTATNTGVNSGGQYCNILGSHVPFDDAKLARLYPTRAAYVAAVARVTDDNLKAGYITRAGADRIKREAGEFPIGATR
jgi:hypothetical protein